MSSQTTPFSRIRALPFRADEREIVDAVNALIGLTQQSFGPAKVGVKSLVAGDSPYTVTADDYLLLVDPASGSVTINLPAKASSDGRVLKIKRTTANNNVVTIDANSSETIDGDATQVILEQYMGYELTCDAATEWCITGVMLG